VGEGYNVRRSERGENGRVSWGKDEMPKMAWYRERVDIWMFEGGRSWWCERWKMVGAEWEGGGEGGRDGGHRRWSSGVIGKG